MKLLAGTALGLAVATLAPAAEAQSFDNNHAALMAAVKGKTVGMLLTDTNTDLTIIWTKVLKHDLEKFGINLEIRDANWNPETQLQALEAFLAEEKKPDVLVIQNFNLTGAVRGIKTATESGIRVIQLNLPSRQLADAYVGVDYVQVGIETGEELVKSCGAGSGKSGKIAVIQGDITGADSLLQMQGLKQVLDQHPEIQVVSTQGTDWDPTKAHDVTATVLQQHPDLCAVYGLWDGHDIGSAEAIKEANLQGKVLNFTNGAGHRKACESVASGLFDKYWSYNSERQGSDLTTAVLMALQSKEPAGSNPQSFFTPLTIIDKENVHPSLCFDTN
jgi:ABC-type sugar transport system substrate-binding protein